jgi:hypothetical protein
MQSIESVNILMPFSIALAIVLCIDELLLFTLILPIEQCLATLLPPTLFTEFGVGGFDLVFYNGTINLPLQSSPT